MKSSIRQIKDLVNIQGEKGNWDSSEYMTGLFNGLEMSLSILEKREPLFRTYTRPPFVVRLRRWFWLKFSSPTTVAENQSDLLK